MSARTGQILRDYSRVPQVPGQALRSTETCHTTPTSLLTEPPPRCRIAQTWTSRFLNPYPRSRSTPRASLRNMASAAPFLTRSARGVRISVARCSLRILPEQRAECEKLLRWRHRRTETAVRQLWRIGWRADFEEQNILLLQSGQDR